MSRDATFWNVIAKRYAKSDIANMQTYERKIAMTQALMRPDMQVLEFGCGTGSTALVHAQKAQQVTGIDYSKKMIEIACDKAQGVSNAQFEVAELKDWTVDDASYDMILGLNVMHLLPDPIGAISDCRRLLKPGGYFVSSTYFLGDAKGLLPRVLPLISATRLVPRVSVMTSEGFIAELKKSGFEVVEDWRPGKGQAAFIIAKAV
jgi:ubiquinone/menaquinone biosynthesis C-methylase UbiE